MILYIENPQESIKQLWELINIGTANRHDPISTANQLYFYTLEQSENVIKKCKICIPKTTKELKGTEDLNMERDFMFTDWKTWYC